MAPVRETAAQLLGVLSRHLSADRVLLVTRHLIYLISLNGTNQVDQSTDTTGSGSVPVEWKNNWMIVHGGLLGIKYLLASRKVSRIFTYLFSASNEFTFDWLPMLDVSDSLSDFLLFPKVIISLMSIVLEQCATFSAECYVQSEAVQLCR